MGNMIAKHWRAVTLLIAGIAAIALLVGPMTLGNASASTRGVLYLSAVADERKADHGDRDGACLFICVNSDGGAQEGLLKGNFLVETQLGSVGVAVTHLSSTGHGVYRLDLEPAGSNTWIKGNYVLSVFVSCPTGTASTVTELRID